MKKEKERIISSIGDFNYIAEGYDYDSDGKIKEVSVKYERKNKKTLKLFLNHPTTFITLPKHQNDKPEILLEGRKIECSPISLDDQWKINMKDLKENLLKVKGSQDNYLTSEERNNSVNLSRVDNLEIVYDIFFS